jgi:hypothetical protein
MRPVEIGEGTGSVASTATITSKRSGYVVVSDA